MIIIGYSHGKKWTKEAIEVEIQKVMCALGLQNRFPTHSEIIGYTGNMKLTNAISKHGGTKYWASRMGCSIKRCESELGDYFEKYAMEDIFQKTRFNSEKMRVGYPFDILTNNFIKVDIKASHINMRSEHNKYYSFNLEKREPTCDIFVLYCIDDKEDICKTYIVPSCFTYGQTQIGISANGSSKWDKFKNAWFYFEKYNSFYNEIMKGVV